jgi:hypothetical protein
LLAERGKDAIEIVLRSEDKKPTMLAADDAGTSGLVGTGTGEAGMWNVFHELDARIWK